jgi:hypothetical protein
MPRAVATVREKGLLPAGAPVPLAAYRRQSPGSQYFMERILDRAQSLLFKGCRTPVPEERLVVPTLMSVCEFRRSMLVG